MSNRTLLRTIGLISVLAMPLVAQQPTASRANGGPFVALHNPRFVPAAQADYLEDSDRVVGVSANGVSKAFPPWVMAFHHVIQDRLADMPIMTTW
jgi:hypothetical protein